jgi:hypothetical protein
MKSSHRTSLQVASEISGKKPESQPFLTNLTGYGPVITFSVAVTEIHFRYLRPSLSLECLSFNQGM